MLTFLGHVIDSKKILPDPKKNQISKFSPNIAHISKPFRELMSSKVVWTWNTAHVNAFKAMQDEISSPWVLALYSIEAKTKVSADASAYALGAVSLQQQDKHWWPVAFASWALSEMETKCDQIEKESLALTWAMEKFAEFVIDKRPFLRLTTRQASGTPSGKKEVVPEACYHHMCWDSDSRFQYIIHHVPRKTALYTADMLSWAPSQELNRETNCLSTEVELFVMLLRQLSQPALAVWTVKAELKLQTKHASNLLNAVSPDGQQEISWAEKWKITGDFVKTLPSVVAYFCISLELRYL